MKKILPILIPVVLALLLVVGALRPEHKTAFDLERFSQMPVQAGGRVQPLDTLARVNLRILSGRESLRLPDGGSLPAYVWLAQVAFAPEQANKLPVFRIESDEVLALFGWQLKDRKTFSFDELRPHFKAIQDAYRQANPEKQLQTAFERQIGRLYQALTQYYRLQASFSTGNEPESPLREYAAWLAVTGQVTEIVRQGRTGNPENEPALRHMQAFLQSYQELAQTASVGIVPPRTPKAQQENRWSNLGDALLDAPRSGNIDPVLASYARLTEAYRKGDGAAFNETLAALAGELAPVGVAGRSMWETLLNRLQPFYQASVLYVLGLLAVFGAWASNRDGVRRSAFWLCVFAFALHTGGLLMRMYLQGRPPVTNLYSSAVFCGWGAALLGLVLERMHRNGIGAAVAAIVGSATLVVAHNLNLTSSSDTMEMMQAVLDSNFWLSTHVVTITIGYSAMFVAGALGFVYILMGTLTPALTKERAAAMGRMTFGAVCFATLFSFVGTMLGGIWADQSWGRFWGWDPKENGALLIVLWCAVILHARGARLVQQRGLMVLAVLGNVVTAWAWFGTNLLGVGLHSYGFMERGALALGGFWLSQFAVVLVGLLPLRFWRSNPAGSLATANAEGKLR